MVPGGGSRVSRTAWVILVAVVLCVASAFLWWRGAAETTRSADAELMRQVREAKSGETVVLVAEASQSPAKDSAPADQRPDYAAKLRAAPDYLEYVRSLLGAARAGDHAAQFYIFRAFEKCKDAYRLYFDRQGVRHSLDEGLRMAAAAGWPADLEVVRRTYDRCHALLDADATEVGDRQQWLRLASKGRFPLALVSDAREVYRKSSLEPEFIQKKLHDLLAEPLLSRDPEVIWEIGDFPLVPDSNDEYENEGMAWMIAACQRGLDCSPKSDAVETLCLWDYACQPYESVTDILRRAKGEEIVLIEARARWINEKIDAGDWAALGF